MTTTTAGVQGRAGDRHVAGTGTADIPVRRFGTPPPLEEDLAYEVMRDEISARTIGEHGAAAVWMAALSAACITGFLLYAA
jgi:hypothetical protein